MSRIKVSIICLVYNHEKYLRQTLEGFLSQKTDFSYEVIIHDDASTDGSVNIIKEYVQKYPKVFKPIYQEFNQFSKGVSIHNVYIKNLVEGEYVALCEGDDYWTDESKLQKQVNSLENNKNCYMCAHTVLEVFENGSLTGKSIPGDGLETGVINSKQFLAMGYAFHTSSYMFCSEKWKTYVENPPEFRKACPVGDQAYMLYFGGLGDVYYLNEVMSNYRRGVPGSWSSRLYQDGIEKKMYKNAKAMVTTLKLFDEYSNGEFHDICAERIANWEYRIAICEKNAKFILQKNGRDCFKYLSKRRKCFILFSILFPQIAKKMYFYREKKNYMLLGY